MKEIENLSIIVQSRPQFMRRQKFRWGSTPNQYMQYIQLSGGGDNFSLYVLIWC